MPHDPPEDFFEVLEDSVYKAMATAFELMDEKHSPDIRLEAARLAMEFGIDFVAEKAGDADEDGEEWKHRRHDEDDD